MSHTVNLNIHWDSPKSVWHQVDQVFASLPGYTTDAHSVYGRWDFEDGFIDASVESSGLQLYSTLSDEHWEVWYEELKTKLTESLGFAVGEPEDGFEFNDDW